MISEVLTIPETARILKTSPRTIYAWLKSGRLPGRKVVGGWRILERDLEQLFASEPALEPVRQSHVTHHASPSLARLVGSAENTSRLPTGK